MEAVLMRGLVAGRLEAGTFVAMCEDVSDVSTRLRRARERKELQIEDISARTKIKPAFLQAIEMGHFETLPGHFFTRAFIKSYAREVGLPADEVVRDFDLVHGHITPVEVEKIAAAVDVKERRVARPSPPRPSSARALEFPQRSWQFAAVAAIVLVVLSFTNRPESTGGASAPAPVVASSAPAPAAVGTSGGAPAPPPEKLTLEIRPTGVIWVNATADGATAVYKLLQPGQNVTVEGRELTFRIGNAAAFEYSINGVRGKPLGGVDEVKEFQITPQNFQSYLR